MTRNEQRNLAVAHKRQRLNNLRDTLRVQQSFLGECVPQTLRKIMPVDRIQKVVLAAAIKDPKVLECDPKTVIRAASVALSLGLEPGGPMQQAYFVPFRNKREGTTELNLIIGYRGYLTLARRSGEFDSFSVETVHENDEFDVELGSNEHVHHKPNYREKRGEIYAAYVIARQVGGGAQTTIMSREDIDAIRDEYSHGNAVWRTNYGEMAKKTVIRRAAKMWPLCADLMDGFDREDRLAAEPDGVVLDGGDLDADGDGEGAEPDGELSDDAAMDEAKSHVRQLREAEQRDNDDAEPAAS